MAGPAGPPTTALKQHDSHFIINVLPNTNSLDCQLYSGSKAKSNELRF